MSISSGRFDFMHVLDSTPDVVVGEGLEFIPLMLDLEYQNFILMHSNQKLEPKAYAEHICLDQVLLRTCIIYNPISYVL